ncbi:hypothetical protein IFM89_020967 [Coptis chinensis]|uniref:Uncharacterized protein n=1 Tax=Coptis chinensis TaxID=261450 RepID=A0A835I9J6_9MAGN|nr:hypothetical protein IFM89_020967 [Coptis chinensis]
MTDGGGGGGPPNNSGGQFLLQLLQKPPQNPKPTSSSHNHQLDFPFQSNGHNNPPQQPIHPPWLNFPGFQSPPNNNNNNNTPWGLAGLPPPPNLHFHANQQHQPPIFADDFQRLGLLGGNNNNNNGRMVGFEPLPPQQKDMQNGGLMFGSVPSDFSVLNGSRVEVDRRNVVQSQFGVQRTGPSASSDIWSNRIREFDHGLNSNGRGQWNNLPNHEQGGGRVGGREIQQQQPHQLQHGRGAWTFGAKECATWFS